ncbi:MAG: hypothetical protein WAW96_17260, partial [Alphaproteobacteria bacterium]
LLCCLCIAACVAAPSKGPRVFAVGPRLEYSKPSEVAALVGPGDTVNISAGTYADCVVWPKNVPGLKLMGVGGDVVLAGKTCAGKAIFVIQGDDTLVRGLTFKGAKVEDHNGAGIRMESRKLTIEGSHFIGNENGILTTSNPDAELIIRNSSFEGNGACIEECAHGLYAGRIARVHIEHSVFLAQHVGHHVKSRAALTEIIDTRIEDGPEGTSSYLVDIPNGGDLFMSGDTLEKGPLSSNKTTAIEIGAEGLSNATNSIRIENCRFTNNTGGPVVFLLNRTTTVPQLTGNAFEEEVIPISGPGSV